MHGTLEQRGVAKVLYSNTFLKLQVISLVAAQIFFNS